MRSAISAKTTMLAAAMAGVSGFGSAVAVPRLPVRFPALPKGAPTTSKHRPGRSGSKLAKLAAKGGIGIRKHW